MRPRPNKSGGSAPLTPVGRRVIVWLAASAIGAAIIAMPDNDARIFSFSGTHGPSAIDLLGIVVLLAGWAPVAWMLWSRRAAIRGPHARFAGVLAVVGVVLLVVTIRLDLGASWIVAVAILLAAQFTALWSLDRSIHHEPGRP